MSKQTEAMKLALEALEELTDTEQMYGALERGDTAINALREALAAQPAQQEPFTYYRHYDNGLQDWPDEKTIPLYTAPQAQPARAPLTWEQRVKIVSNAQRNELDEYDLIEAIESAHGITK